MNVHRSLGRSTFLGMVVLLGVGGIGFSETAQAPAVKEGVRDRAPELLRELSGAKSLAGRWGVARRIEDLGPEVIPLVKEAMGGQGSEGRLVLAKILYALGDATTAAPVAVQLVCGDGPREIRIAAAGLIAAFGLPPPAPAEGAAPPATPASETSRDLEKLLGSTTDRDLQIAIARALWAIGTSEQQQQVAYRAILQALHEGDEAARLEAALALGEMSGGQPLPPEAQKVLKPYENEPTEIGRRASAVLQVHRLVHYTVRELQYRGKLVHPLLEEIRQKIQTNYVDANRIGDAYLVESGARGMAEGLDRFSSYMSKEEWSSFREGMSGEYAGIGATVGVKDGKVLVLKAFYFGPAYRAGLRSGDQITEISGVNVEGKPLEQVIIHLRGQAGSAVQLKVRRRRVPEIQTMDVKREVIQIPSVYWAPLPGKLGYVRAASFGENTAREMDAALDGLEKDPGIVGLLLDLRDNPGGLLEIAVQMSSRFLDVDKLVVSSEGRNKQLAPRQEYRTEAGGRVRQFPLVVLVNGNSASASEIVAGALQDHRRARLVGERTFGKGSVQQLMPLEAVAGASALRLTIAKYFLPSGRCIHEVGIPPDVNAAPKKWDTEEVEQIKKLPDEPFEDYYWDRKEKHGDLLRSLAENDRGAVDRYPDFDSWRPSIQGTLSKQAVRLKLRTEIRRLVSDEQGRDYVYDIVEDTQLQQGVKELARMLDLDLTKIDDYSHLGR